jgi:uncharacterized protein YqhQ
MSQEKLSSYGGQALMEGVLMRGSKAVAAAIRTPAGNIEIIEEDLQGIYRTGIRKVPFLRGLIALWDALGLGTRFLTMSANFQAEEGQKIEGPTLYITLGLSFALSISLFFLLPASIGQLAEGSLEVSSWLGNLLEGFLRLAFLVAYIASIGRMKEIQRVFAYHGAEHKTINAYEAGAELTVEEVKKYSVEHPRCGTGFILSVALISILIFTLLGPMPLFWRLFTRIVFIPIIAGLAYEYMRWTADHSKHPLVAALIKPNLALQRLTTREPDESMLEVALTAFKAMFVREQSLAEQKVFVPVYSETNEVSIRD